MSPFSVSFYHYSLVVTEMTSVNVLEPPCAMVMQTGISWAGSGVSDLHAEKETDLMEAKYAAIFV